MAYEMTVLRSRRVPFTRGDAWRFKGRGSWLDRLRKWLWYRWSEPAIEQCETFGLKTISDESMVDLVLSAIRGHKMERSLDELDRIVVGGSQFYTLQSEAFERSLSFGCPVHVCDGPGCIRILNIPVQVVPWFDGVLLIPKMDQPRKSSRYL